MRPRRSGSSLRFWAAWAAATAAALVLVVLATLPPLLAESARDMLMQAFAPLCHQMPARSPHWHGLALAVCDRCYGIYLGLPLAAGVYLAVRRWEATLFRRAGLVLVVSLAPMGVDWAGHVVGLWTNTPHTRFVTGIIFGVAAGFLFVRAVVDGLLKKRATA